MRKWKLKVFSLLLAALMLSVTVLPVSAEESATAATMQLAKTTGTVDVTNSSGRSLTKRDNMMLYNGYHVETQAKSYAWINLDGAKLTKLDASSEVEIRKSGKKLELLLSSGNIFFNVTSPLTSEETLNIRTSTMVTGIRGTCGWIQMVDRWTTEIYVLEGSVQCNVTDPVTGQIKTATVESGEKAVAVAYPQDREGDKCEFLQEQIEVRDIGGFVLEELAQDPELCEEIHERSGLDVRNITEKAVQERLEHDEQKLQDTLDRIGEETGKQDSNVSADPVWDGSASAGTGSGGGSGGSGGGGSGGSGGGGSGSGGSGGSGSGGGSTVDDMTMPKTAAQVLSLLERYDAVTLLPSAVGSENTLTVDIAEMVIEKGKTLILSDGISVKVQAQSVLTVNGTLTGGERGRLTIEDGGELTVAGSNTLDFDFIYNYGVLMNESTGRIVTDTIDTSNLFSSAGAIDGRVVVAGGYAALIGGTLDGLIINQGGTVDLNGAAINAGNDDRYAARLESGKFAMNSGTITGGTMCTVWVNDGAFTMSGGTIEGAVYAGDSAFTMAGGVIDNHSVSFPAVALAGSTFILDGGTIKGSGNTAIDCANSIFNMENGTVSSSGFSTVAYRVDNPGGTMTPALTLSGGTITNDGDGYALTVNDVNVTIQDTAVIKARNNEYVGGSYGGDGSSVDPWAPPGYAPTAGPGDDGYYYLAPKTSGAAGASVTWSYDNGVLTISGAGDMYDYDSAASQPWYNFRGEITTVTIRSGVSRIGDNAFHGCAGLTDAAIPVTVTSIGDYAFNDCGAGALRVSYGGNADRWYSLLTNTGENNDPLRSAIVTYAEAQSEGVFSNASITWEIYEDGTMFIVFTGSGSARTPDLSRNDGAPWAGSETQIKKVIVGEHVTGIGAYTFNGCTNLTEVTILDRSDFGSIGMEAFSGCSRLTEMDFPGSISTIEGAAFENCTGLKSVTIPEAVSTTDVSIRQSAFKGCTGLENVNIIKPVKELGDSAFSGCANLAAVTIRESYGNLVIGASAFWKCTGLTDVTLPDGGVTGIGASAFYDCRNLTGLNIPNSVTAIGAGAFYNCRMSSVTIPSGVASIAERTFSSCANLTNVTIPEGVKTIGESAFEGCAALTSVIIPLSVDTIGPYVFLSSSLTNIYYAGTQQQWEAISGYTNVPGAVKINYESTGPDGDGYSLGEGGTVALSAAGTHSFTDVPGTAWYNGAVQYVYEHDLMDGTGGGAFSPDGAASRGMLVTILHRMEGRPSAPGADFADVPAGQWYAPAVAWAGEHGIVTGYDDGNFRPNDPVSREQMAAILYRYAKHKGYAETSLGNAAAFPDGDRVSAYAADAVGWAVGNGLLQGSDGLLSPDGGATRAQAATILMRFREDAARSYPMTVISSMDVMCEPSGILFLEDGSFLATDTYNNVIWRVKDGSGTVYAGGDTVSDPYDRPVGGYNDASLKDSYFNDPWAIAPFRDGYAVTDAKNNVLRLIRAKTTQTVNGSTEEDLTLTDLGVAFDHPTGLAADEAGNLYVSDTFAGAVRRITPEGTVTTVIDGLTDPMGLCWKDGTLYIAETGANRIVKVTDGGLAVVAGSGEEGLTDGGAARAAFAAPRGVTVGEDGTIYVSDTVNGAVRRIKNGVVTTLALRDESDLDAFVPTSPVGLALRGDQLYVCDSFARKIFVISLAR